MPVIAPPAPGESSTRRTPEVNSVKYESTPSGDVVVVVENSHTEKGHRRELSAHFDVSTRLNEDTDENKRPVPLYSTKYPSPAVGSKHRRIFSGDVSNPSVAHRRIDSVGQTAPVDRAYYTTATTIAHRRDHSAGLDILSAAADATKEELSVAAGPPPSYQHQHQHHYQHPPPLHVDYNQRPSQYQHNTYPPPPPQPAPQYYHHSPQPHYYSVPSSAPPLQHYNHPSNPAYPNSGYSPQYTPPRQQSKTSQSVPPNTTPEVKAENRSREWQLPKAGSTQRQYLPPPRNNNHETKTEQPPANTPSPQLVRNPGQWQPPKTGPVQSYVSGVPSNSNDNGNDNAAKNSMPPPTHPTTAALPPPGLSTPNPHHRKLSSQSSLGTWINSGLIPEPADVHTPGHHRSTSSTVSFLQGIEETAELLLQGMETPPGPPPQHLTPSPAHYSTQAPRSTAVPQPTFVKQPQKQQVIYSRPADMVQSSETQPPHGGACRRMRRKCTITGCTNRVVQGGLCISHGAKRKICKHPGCIKNVKKAGLCSTHGPARKRCEAEGCAKVAVQGGKCIAHGAKKKLCEIDNCTKQAIMSGMCKKHHDQNKGGAKKGGKNKVHNAPQTTTCVVIDHSKEGAKPTHQRGLSIFQEMSAESMESLLADEVLNSVHPLKK